ncbi:L-seryl-tRNA(Sec) selenium transferase [Siccirubricoccus deserti]|uniref:L-seryl-tRNA(Sec) selenium transferase n=1 Tax=Siccirubricoccus deserti TaxID=2013562 RepID=A0A9X0UH51_9PROT|nr:L-seryl-tRNA(Sec) selenium transferase [Siccirubricoccus deserti]MBC4015895.1 L-seryl-tRNA(Sec) selenium transferase [Siccirubricoccus deserti]GGC45441.1 L-seryl-tRNA(Sec) selenium transferase [Siccirubricoccus deserti]
MDAANPRALPAMHRLLSAPEAVLLAARHPRPALAAALRAELDALRRSGRGFTAASFFAAAEAALEAAARPGLRRVINATGVVLHTNLGRAPLPAAALAAIAAEVGGYCNLELDLEAGARGDRHAACAALLAELTGAEAGLVVNNGAAAMLLALSALAAGGEAVVSRGELVEIGGGFRIPEVIRQGGARLAEVGTTNRTRLADYAAAIGPETRLLLRVHQSNYRITGFTAAPDPAALAALAHAHGLLAVEDLGSGALLDLTRLGLPREPTLTGSIAAGFDLVVASGDKLLGGPQAGLILGRREVVGRLARHPLMRALRPDKLTLAALEAVLRLYRDPEGVVAAVPALAMLVMPREAVAARAMRLAALLPPGAAELVEGESLVGGGSLPGVALPTCLLALPGPAEALAARLRAGRPAVVGRIGGGRLLLDPRTVAEAEVETLAEAVRAALAA